MRTTDFRLLFGFSLLAFAVNTFGIEKLQLVEQWQCSGFDTPESVLYDAARNILYVSSVSGNPMEKDGRGFVSRVSPDGDMETLKWATGLNAPKGMAISGGTLYVSDIDELVQIDLKTGSVTAKYPAKGAQFLNDVAADTAGYIYVGDSSSENSVIYRLGKGELEVWLRDPAVRRPNGLHMQADRLLVGNARDGGLNAVDLKSKAVAPIATATTGIDGLKPLGNGAYLISDWAGKISLIKPSGKTVLLMDTSESNINAADFEYIADRKLLLVPTFFDHRVVAYTLVGLAASADTPKVGDFAPAFEATNQDGHPWKLADHLGKYVVVYFYPAAMTGGCTKQACSYRDFVDEGSGIDLEIVGISSDTPQSLKFFQQANQLNFPLLSDPDGTIAKRYGVPVKEGKKSIRRSVDGQEVVLERSSTAARWTFIIDRQGRLVDINTKVRAAEDRNTVIEFIRNREAL